MSKKLNTRDVVLLHGLGRTRWSMWPLAWRLGRSGFRCHRLGYASTRQQIAQSLDEARDLIARLARPVHLVGHSLGGLISARLLREGALPIGHVVQLGAPNLGSPAADLLGGRWPVRRLCGPAVAELHQHVAALPDHDRIGAIAGTHGPDLPGIPIDPPHDGIVAQASAWAGAAHRATHRGTHSFLPASARIARLTACFLTHGRFPESTR